MNGETARSNKVPIYCPLHGKEMEVDESEEREGIFLTLLCDEGCAWEVPNKTEGFPDFFVLNLVQR